MRQHKDTYPKSTASRRTPRFHLNHSTVTAVTAVMNLWTLAQIPLAILLLWLFTTYTARSLPTLINKRILLLIAHPDDEAMFFSPTLTWLTRPDLGNTVMLLCLSPGDADGLGHVRKAELVQSALMLGVREREHVVVLEDEKLRDGMDQAWDARYIGSILTGFFAPGVAKQSSKQAPKTNVDVIITFDKGGVSGHPNHIALLAGAKNFLDGLMARHRGWESPVKLYSLRSTSVLRKYASVLDAPLTVLWSVFSRKEKGEYPTPLLMVGGPGDVRRAQRAMTTGHRSQMRWFRWGWIGVSRYMVMNDLVKVKGV